MFWNYNVKSIEWNFRWSKNVWACTGGWVIFENDSVESDCGGKSDANETADQ